MMDTQIQCTSDGRLKVGDLVTITLDWAHQLRRAVYDGRKTVEEILAERTGRVLEIWIGGAGDTPVWCSVLLDCTCPHPWEQVDDLEIVVAQ